MGSPVSLLGEVRGFARDFPRDRMPDGYLWDVVDFVPSIIDAQLTGRGKWMWASQTTGYGPIGAGILASFQLGDQVLVQTTDASPHVLKLNPDPDDPAASTWTDRGVSYEAVQNPVQLGESVIHFRSDNGGPPQLWRVDGATSANAAHKWAPVGTVWQSAMVSGGAIGEEHLIRFSVAGKDLTAADSFDTNAFMPTGGRVTALQGMRGHCLIFHPASVERLRGGPLPNTAAGRDDRGLVLERIFNRVGCIWPKSIAVWNDQCIFADEHGVHMTDGAVIRNLTSQGGISYYWRLLFEGAVSVVATTFLDYYIVSLRYPITRPPPPSYWHSETAWEPESLVTPLTDPAPRPPIPPIPPVLDPIRPPPPEPIDTYNATLACDLNRKRWFRISNVNARSLFSGGDRSGMERIFAGLGGYTRLARLAPMFYPDETSDQVDANGVTVKPRFETAWYRLSQEGRKRIRFGYLSYDCRGFAPVTDPLRVGYLTDFTVGNTYQDAGILPLTLGYRRYRLPVYKFPYGIAFYVEAIGPTAALRIYDLGVEAQAAERSRV